MWYAVLNGGSVVDRRWIPDWDSYPEHKRTANDEKGDGGPVLRSLVIEGDGPIETVTVEANRVLITRSHPALDAVKRSYKALLETDAETQRQRFITSGPGKALEYLEAKEQALAVLAMTEADANALANHGEAEFPIISASVPHEAASLYAAAQLIMSRYEAWAQIGGRIKRACVAGKAAIDQASDVASVKAAYEAVTWDT